MFKKKRYQPGKGCGATANRRNRGKKLNKVFLSLVARDGHWCHWCGAYLTVNTATKDHVIPKSHGGSNSLKNLVLACEDCNFDRGDKKYEDYCKIVLERQQGFLP